MITEINATVKLATEQCSACSIIFAMPADLQLRARNNPEVRFYCPQGHSMHYTESESAKKLRLTEKLLADERARSQRQAEELTRVRSERDHHWIERKKLTTRTRNLKTRIKNGVCPCCHRSFPNLHDHMKTQHPTFATEPTLESEATA